ncbi:amidase family protein [Saccharopolyspora sp. K220]|uniref:amidase family protein n=1 Tax=Saccharopolyspora soli TaxID=2926618 RepID=UPI001F5661C9|nr:amidase family protein [Saccharopolyspora soli]MCI2424029.1 amidase family protein [Saccharopolyspora soli]
MVRGPERDGTVAARLRTAGAIVLGHSNMPSLLAAYPTDDAISGRTNKPCDLGRNPSGASGGGTAALTSGMTMIEVGADCGGSLRFSHISAVSTG